MSVDLYEGDTLLLRRVFGEFPTGVAALAAHLDDGPVVLIASSFQVGISLEPPLVLVSVQRTSTTWPQLQHAARIGVSILGNANAGAAKQLASKERALRFDGVATTSDDGGAVYIDDSAAWLECVIEQEYPAGDHDVVLLRVLGLRVHDDHEPLVFHRSAFRSLH